MIVTLTQQEREKFFLWLQQEAESNRGLVGEMEKIGSIPGPVIDIRKAEAAACLVVAKILSSTESMTLREGTG